MTIARPTTVVFDYTADLRHEPSWDMEVEVVPASTDAVLEIGKEYPVRFRPFLGEAEGTLTAIEMAPGQRLCLEVRFAGMTSRITYLFAPEAGGTRFTRQVEARLVGMMRLVVPVVALRVRRTNQRDVLNLKRILEAG